MEESRQQQAMVAQALEDLGESPSTLKDTAMGILQNVQMMAHLPEIVSQYIVLMGPGEQKR